MLISWLISSLSFVKILMQEIGEVQSLRNFAQHKKCDQKWQLWWPDNFCTLSKNKIFDTFGKLCTWKNQVTILNFQNKHSLEKILQPETEWVNLSERYMSCFFTNCKRFSSKKETVVERFTERTIVNLAMWTKQKNFLKN